MKTFYIIVQDRDESDENKIYKLQAETEQDAQEKFMKYICKIPMEFDQFTSILENSEIYIYVISNIINIE